MDIVQRELTKLAAAAVIVNEMATASETQKTASMDKEALNFSSLRQKLLNMLAMQGSPRLDLGRINSALKQQMGVPSKTWLSKRGLEFSVDAGLRRPGIGGFVGGTTRGHIVRNNIFPRMDDNGGVDPLRSGWYDVLMSAQRPGRLGQWFTPYPKAQDVTWAQALRSILGRG